jgi:hypothetical protein
MTKPGQIPVRRGIDRATFNSEIVDASLPVVLAGLVADWPFVDAARESSGALAREIRALDAGLRPHVIEAAADAGGRIFYRDDFTGFNFTRRPAAIGDVLDRLLQLANAANAPTLFLESVSTTAYLPGFALRQRMPLLDERVEPRIWIGNAVKVNTHFDLAHNIACVVGRPAPLHAFSAGPDREPLPGSARFHAVRRARQHGAVHGAGSLQVSAICRRPCATRCTPSSAPAMRCSFPTAGGTTSSR